MPLHRQWKHPLQFVAQTWGTPKSDCIAIIFSWNGEFVQPPHVHFRISRGLQRWSQLPEAQLASVNCPEREAHEITAQVTPGKSSPRGFPAQSWGHPTSWMVYFKENPKITWMMTGGTPMTYENSIWSQSASASDFLSTSYLFLIYCSFTTPSFFSPYLPSWLVPYSLASFATMMFGVLTWQTTSTSRYIYIYIYIHK